MKMFGASLLNSQEYIECSWESSQIIPTAPEMICLSYSIAFSIGSHHLMTNSKKATYDLDSKLGCSSTPTQMTWSHFGRSSTRPFAAFSSHMIIIIQFIIVLPETTIYFKFPAKKSPLQIMAHLTITSFTLQLWLLFYDFHICLAITIKKGCKIRLWWLA